MTGDPNKDGCTCPFVHRSVLLMLPYVTVAAAREGVTANPAMPPAALETVLVMN